MDKLLQRLHYYQTINPDIGLDHFEIGRHTYCHLMYKHDGQWHKNEVRGFKSVYRDGVLESINISAVNWSVAAGPCGIVITQEHIDLVKILEDEPTMQVLYG